MSGSGRATACWFLAVESLFEKELRRRGIDASDPSTSKGPPEQQRTATRPAPGFRGAPSEDDYDVPPQLARSRALQSEGLEVSAGGRSSGGAGQVVQLQLLNLQTRACFPVPDVTACCLRPPSNPRALCCHATAWLLCRA